MTTTMWKNARFELVDPRTLLLEGNSRTIKDIERDDPVMCSSIKAHGVQIPVIVNPTDDGRYRVRDGFSRTMIAILAITKHPQMPILVTESEDEEEWQRLRDQWNANEIRRGYSNEDKARLLEQMTLFGLSTEQVAEELSTTVETVEAALQVRRSAAASKAIQDFPQLEITQAAELARFEDDEVAFQELMITLNDDPDEFEHTLSQWQQRYQLRAACEQLSTELTAAGVEVITSPMPDGTLRLSRLQRSRSDDTQLDHDIAAHATCAGHAAIIEPDHHRGAARAIYVCCDWKARGHVDSYAAAGSSGGGKMSDEQKANLARAKRNHPEWRAAEPVRRKALQKLLTAPRPPKQAAQFISETLVIGEYELRKAMEKHHVLVCELLGLKKPQPDKPHPLLAKIKKATVAEATMITLAVLIAAFEESTSVETWRSPSDEQKRYFKMLKVWGIRQHWVERLVNDPTADKDQGYDNIADDEDDSAHEISADNPEPSDLGDAVDGIPDDGDVSSADDALERDEGDDIVGRRVELTHTNDADTELVPGDLGTVAHVDDAGTVHIAWDNGSSLGLSTTEGDTFRVVDH